MTWANWCGTVHHGLPEQLHRLGRGDAGYLAFLGRICPEKRVDRAIEIARPSGAHRCGLRPRSTRSTKRISSSSSNRCWTTRWSISSARSASRQNAHFSADAAALLFPIDWPEPFGLVMIEAMATGTPVIAFGCGSVPEIIEEGVTGFIVDDIESAAAAVPLALRLDRASGPPTLRTALHRRADGARLRLDSMRGYCSGQPEPMGPAYSQRTISLGKPLKPLNRAPQGSERMAIGRTSRWRTTRSSVSPRPKAFASPAPAS